MFTNFVGINRSVSQMRSINKSLESGKSIPVTTYGVRALRELYGPRLETVEDRHKFFRVNLRDRVSV